MDKESKYTVLKRLSILSKTDLKRRNVELIRMEQRVMIQSP